MILLNIGTRDSAALLRFSVGVANARVIAVGVSEDDESEIVSCAESGVVGYHLRSESLDDLLTLIQRIMNGESACSAHVGAILLRRLSKSLHDSTCRHRTLFSQSARRKSSDYWKRGCRTVRSQHSCASQSIPSRTTFTAF